MRLKPKSPTVAQIRNARREQDRAETAQAIRRAIRHRRIERLANLLGILLVLAWGATIAAAAIRYLISEGGAH